MGTLAHSSTSTTRSSVRLTDACGKQLPSEADAIDCLCWTARIVASQRASAHHSRIFGRWVADARPKSVPAAARIANGDRTAACQRRRNLKRTSAGSRPSAKRDALAIGARALKRQNAWGSSSRPTNYTGTVNTVALPRYLQQEEWKFLQREEARSANERAAYLQMPRALFSARCVPWTSTYSAPVSTPMPQPNARNKAAT